MAYAHKEHALSNSPSITQLAGTAPAQRDAAAQVPREPLGKLFLRFLKFGSLAWVVPVAQIAMIRQALDRPEESPPRMVFITSISSTLASVNRGEYCVSKAGLSMVARLFAVRLAEYGIAVFEVRPGIVATDMTAGVRAAYDRRLAEGLAPIRRWGMPEDVGRVVGLLVDGGPEYATGQVFDVDGGLALPRL